MATNVYPSANDVATTAGQGSKVLEKRLCTWLKTLIGQNCVKTGFTMPGTHGDLGLPVAAGEALIDGHFCEITTSTDVTLTDNILNYIFLKLVKDVGGLVDSLEFEANTTGIAPADSVYIGTATTSGSTVTATADGRVLKPILDHDHTSNGEEGGDIAFIIVDEKTGSDVSSSVINVTTGTDLLSSSMTLTTTALSRVHLTGRIYINQTGDPGAGVGFTFRLYRDSTVIDQIVVPANVTDMCLTLNKIDNPGAGSPVYKLNVLASDSQTTNTVLTEIYLSALQLRL